MLITIQGRAIEPNVIISRACHKAGCAFSRKCTTMAVLSATSTAVVLVQVIVKLRQVENDLTVSPKSR